MLRKSSLGLAAVFAAAVLLWLVGTLATGSDQLTFGIDRTSSGYQSQDFSPAFNTAVTRVEELLYDTNRRYSLFWKLKRIVVAIGALAGIGAAAVSFSAERSSSDQKPKAIRVLGVVFGLISALCPPALGYLDSEGEAYLVKSKELKAGIDSSLTQIRTNGRLEPDLILELNALATRSG